MPCEVRRALKDSSLSLLFLSLMGIVSSGSLYISFESQLHNVLRLWWLQKKLCCSRHWASQLRYSLSFLLPIPSVCFSCPSPIPDSTFLLLCTVEGRWMAQLIYCFWCGRHGLCASTRLLPQPWVKSVNGNWESLLLSLNSLYPASLKKKLLRVRGIGKKKERKAVKTAISF